MPRDPRNGAEHGGPPPYQLATWLVLGAAIVVVLGLFSVRCPLGPETARGYAARSLPPEPKPTVLPPPPHDDEYYPCSDCHEDEPTDRTVRELVEEHEDLELSHGNLWCLDCHDADQRDFLHRADRRRVSFEESWRLCTQCHAKKLADWRAGVHGKREGYWHGPKEVWTCVACHNPHSPHFKALEPKPPPKRPEEITLEALTTSATRDPDHGKP